MTSGYLELESHNDVVYFYLPRCDLTYRPSVVLHAEPKYKFDLYLVTTN